jgi:hypothetical protein
MNIYKEIKKALGIGKKITEKDLLKIRKTDWETLAIWWSELNSWKWVDELLPEESPQYKYDPDNPSRRSLLMRAIEHKVGEKYLLRILNVKRGDTEEEFEDFWLGTHENDKEAYKRFENRIKQSINQTQQ